ncbi:hypothetical protein F4678DRAFT_454353 [Xylaria arbuscula]|nr:hypothetical protein F4678DRAFT_454353 [Xylaria arbuscula]
MSPSGFRQQPGIACESCRKKKSRCDRVRPGCGSCTTAGVTCVFTDSRAQRGPKKGQLQALRARVASLEHGIDHQRAYSIDSSSSRLSVANTPSLSDADVTEAHILDGQQADEDIEIDFDFDYGLQQRCDMLTGCQDVDAQGWSDMLSSLSTNSVEQLDEPLDELIQWPENNNPLDTAGDVSNLESPLRPCQVDKRRPNEQECQRSALGDLASSDLDQLYFDRVHAMLPFIHRGRYAAWARQPGISAERVGLQSAMRCMAAVYSASYRERGGSLYRTARRIFLDVSDAAQGRAITLERIQCCLLVACYEYMTAPSREAMITAARAFRMIQRVLIPELHAFDTRPEYLMSVSDTEWSDVEEKRRTFWAAYCLDGLAGLYHDCPSILQDEGIRIRLPAPESNFQRNNVIHSSYAHEAITVTGAQSIVSAFTECTILLAVWSRFIARGFPTTMQSNRSNALFDYQSRYQWFILLLKKRRALLTEAIPPPHATSDAMFMLAMLVSDSIAIQLADTLHTTPCIEYTFPARTNNRLGTKEAIQAAMRIVKMAPCIANIGCFTVHLFVPQALCKGAEVLLKSDPATADDVNHIEHVSNLLRDLQDVSYSARECLRLIEQNDFSASRVQSMLGL